MAEKISALKEQYDAKAAQAPRENYQKTRELDLAVARKSEDSNAVAAQYRKLEIEKEKVNAIDDDVLKEQIAYQDFLQNEIERNQYDLLMIDRRNTIVYDGTGKSRSVTRTPEERQAKIDSLKSAITSDQQKLQNLKQIMSEAKAAKDEKIKKLSASMAVLAAKWNEGQEEIEAIVTERDSPPDTTGQDDLRNELKEANERLDSIPTMIDVDTHDQRRLICSGIMVAVVFCSISAANLFYLQPRLRLPFLNMGSGEYFKSLLVLLLLAGGTWLSSGIFAFSSLLLGVIWFCAGLLSIVVIVWLAIDGRAKDRAIAEIKAERQRTAAANEAAAQRYQQQRQQEEWRQAQELQARQEQANRERELRDSLRADCERLYLLYKPEVQGRLTPADFAQLIKSQLTDSIPVDEFRRRAEAIKEIIQQHREKVDPAKKFTSIAELSEWYLAERARIDSLAIDEETKEEHKIALDKRYTQLCNELLRKVTL